jgi:precorrin-6B methylase 2
MSTFHKSFLILLAGTLALLVAATGAAAQHQGGKSPESHQDLTDAKTWIKRLERPERIPGLKIDDVIACLKLKPGEVVADIGAGTGAFSIPFAKAVAPSGKVFAVDIWPGLLDYINEKAKKAKVTNLQTILAKQDDPMLPKNQVDVAFFHDVFHNTNDRQAYLKVLASCLKPAGRIAIIEQEFNDPIAKKWDFPQDRITKEQVKTWMANAGFHLSGDFDIFEGANNPKGTGLPQRWFVVYARNSASGN